MKRFLDTVFAPICKNWKFFSLCFLLLTITPVFYMGFMLNRVFFYFIFTLVQGIALSYVITLLIALIHNERIKKAIKTLVISLLGLAACVECGTIASTERTFDLGTLMLVLETNASEIHGFFAQYFSFRTVIALLCVVVYCVVGTLLSAKLRKYINRHRALSTSSLCLLAAAIIGGAIYIGKNLGFLAIDDPMEFNIWTGQGFKSAAKSRPEMFAFAPSPIKAAFLAKSYTIEASHNQEYLDNLEKSLSLPCHADSTRNFNVVVIIGESFVRKHTPLYGYRLPTTPNMMKEKENGRLVVFDDVMTTANFTTQSIQNLMHTNNLADGEQWYEGLYFPNIVKRAGWNVYHFDNQTIDKHNDTAIGTIFYSDFNLRHTYDEVSDSIFEYDMDYARYVAAKIDTTLSRNTKNLVIYHLKGQHFVTTDRFNIDPVFTIDDVPADMPRMNEQRRQEIADYDNATFYNDMVIAEILKSWQTTPTIAFYFSDHGEDLWDLGVVGARNKQMPDDPEWIDRQFHIPFIVWLSDDFKRQYPEIESSIIEASGKPGSLDYFGHIIMGLCGIQSGQYRPELDILNPDYAIKQRFTTNGYTLN